MATVIINEERLSAIGDAIRAKTGNSELLRVADMPAAIEGIETGGGGEGVPEEAFNLTGNTSQMFSNNNWKWFIDGYGDKVKTKNLTNTSNMFYGSNQLEEMPFDLNYYENFGTVISATNMFSSCNKLKKIGKIVNFYAGNMSYMFSGCYKLRELPEFVNLDMSNHHSATPYYDCNTANLFNRCGSLRRIPEDLLKQLWTNSNATYRLFYQGGLGYCYALDEARGFPVVKATLTSNAFSSTFQDCWRLKDIIFDTDDGQPKVVSWTAQTIDLSPNVGYTTWLYTTLTAGDPYDPGITADKRVYDDATYQALKDDPDWFTNVLAYSRYNHDSAVNTINSLPDTSGGNNTIKFKGDAGSATDGGAINTLTAEEIAVAAAKGWTVAYV